MFRGAGYIHLTGRKNYENFYDFIGDAAILYRGYQVVGGVYNKPIKDIANGEIGVINVGQYAWEVSGWFWTYKIQELLEKERITLYKCAKS